MPISKNAGRGTGSHRSIAAVEDRLGQERVCPRNTLKRGQQTGATIVPGERKMDLSNTLRGISGFCVLKESADEGHGLLIQACVIKKKRGFVRNRVPESNSLADP
jgi:hypothetical protein